MLKIVRVPRRLQDFFRPLRKYFTNPQWRHFQVVLLAAVITFNRRNISGLNRTIANGSHRTKLNSFFINSPWDCKEVLQAKAYQLLKGLNLLPGETIYLIIDDSHNPKRGKKMAAVGKFKDPLTGHFIIGHNYVAGLLYCRGIIIPFAVNLYAKKEYCQNTKKEFKKTTELAAEIIRSFQPPDGIKVIVLFDSYYMCKVVGRAIKDKGFHLISTLKSNRNIYCGRGQKKKAGSYGKNTYQRKPNTKVTVTETGQRKVYRAVESDVFLPGFGMVKVVFSKKKGLRKLLTIVSDDVTLSLRQIVRIYSYRWSIEVFFKNGKQNLGLGEYQTQNYDGVVKHLHLTFIAYSLLTHLQIKQRGAKGKKKKRFATNSIGDFQNQVRMIILKDLLHYLYRKQEDRKRMQKLYQVFNTS